MISRYAQWLQSHRLAVYLLCTVLTVLAASGVLKLTFKADYRVFFASDDLGYTQFRVMEQRFPTSDDLVFVLTPADGQVFTREIIQTLEWLKGRLAAMPHVQQVTTLTDYPFQFNEDGELYVAYLTDEPSEAYPLSRFRERALQDPMISGTLLGVAGKSAAAIVSYKLPGRNDLVEYPQAMQGIDDIRRELAATHPDIHFSVSGVLAYNHAIINISLHDLLRLLPVCALLITAILYLFLRSWRGTLFTLAVLGLSLASSLGIWGWLGMPLNSATVSAPIAILALAVADCLHLSDSYLQSAREKPGLTRVGHITRSLQQNSKPIFLTSLTSVLGFLSMNFSDSPPFRDLGNLISIGIVLAWIYSVTLFPALAGQFGLRHSDVQHGLNRSLARLAEFICRHYRRILAMYGLVILGSLAALPLNRLDDNITEWFQENYQVRRDAEFIDRHHTGMFQLYYVIDTGKADGALNPELLQQIYEFTAWLRAQPEVVQARSIADLLALSYGAMRGEDVQLPPDKVMARQIISTMEMLSEDGGPLRSFLNPDRSALRLHASLHTMPASDFIAVEKRASAWLAEHAPEVDIGVGGVSPSMMFARLSQLVVPNMLLSTASMILLISLLLTFIFHSRRLGLLSLLPNLLPIGMAFGIWALLSGHVGIALSIVAGASLGIVVDDTIHLLIQYQRARAEWGKPPAEAVKLAMTHVGGALTITTLILVAAFLVLGFSTLQPNAEIGSMIGLIIAIALITDLLFLPAVLLWIEQRWPLFARSEK